MIQSCPSCGTVFRHSEPRSGLRARCSCCLEEFPLATRPTYRVSVPVEPAPTLLAASRATSFHVAGPRGESPAAFLSRAVRQVVDVDLPVAPPGIPAARHLEPAMPAPAKPAFAPRDTLEPRIVLESAASDSGPAVWLAAAALGTLAGLAVDAAVVGPMGAWPLGGALVGLMVAWGHRRWTLQKP